MKRILCSLAALVVLWGVAAATSWGLPNATALTAVTEGEGDLLYAAENTALTASVYTLRQNVLVAVHREPRFSSTQSFSIKAISPSEGQLYALRQWDDGHLEVVSLSGTLAIRTAEPLALGLQPTGLTMHNGTPFITLVGKDGSVQVLTLSKEGVLTLELTLSSPPAGRVVHASYDTARVRATLNTGEGYYLSPTAKPVLANEVVEKTIPAVALQASSWLLCKRALLLFVTALWLLATTSVLLLLRFCRRSDSLAARLVAVPMGILLAAMAAGSLLVLMEVVRRSGPSALPSTALYLFGASMTILGVAWVSLLFATRHMTAPLARMQAQMSRMADGDVSVKPIDAGQDEIHRMHQSLQELCMSLSIRDYELKATVQSYHRFVPQGLAGLLHRATIAEVALDDSRRIEGAVGLCSIPNRALAHSALDDAQYVRFVDQSFQLLDSSMQETEGCLLSGGLSLASMEILFPDASSGVRAGLSFLGQIRAHHEEGIPAPDLSLLLHHTSFLYSITGSEKKLFPYLASSELEFLSGFSQRFYETGVRVVVTESYHQKLLHCGFSTRYIGFVSLPEKGFAFKLYEVLDAYPEMERNLRMRYNQRLQEAINLFYRSDFYLARNLFSALLRVCPEDGVARWYLFACEYFFSRENNDDANYQLFGVYE